VEPGQDLDGGITFFVGLGVFATKICKNVPFGFALHVCMCIFM
jgi:hypothetical protein